MRHEGFAPVIADNPTLLILGSLPGVRSIEEQRYYAHPRNVFWRIMSELIGFDLNASYESRCRALTSAGVALWDVLQESHREGSLDSAIDMASARTNDFEELFACKQSIRAIACNGAKAYDMFQKRVVPKLADNQVPVLLKLPSSSPANAAISYEQKLRDWSTLRQFLD